MPRLIDADALMEKLLGRLREGEVLYRIPPSEIDNAPTIEAKPVKHGQWEKTEDDFYMGLTIFKCSVCCEEWVFGDMFDVDGLNYHYCPNCGAKMRSDDE